MGHVPTPVAVITTTLDGEPAGLAVGSLFSLSLEPPLMGFCVAKSSTTWPKIREAGRFCTNVLGKHQEAECRTFSSKTPNRFADVECRPTALGSPRLVGAIAWLDCTILAVHDGGDHDIVVGLVHDLDVGDQGAPLIFHRGAYTSLADP